MGAWGKGLFDNDGAADVIAAVNAVHTDPVKLTEIFDSTLLCFENFLKRDAEGRTFRPSTAEELAENDQYIRDALADTPELLAQWNDDAEPIDASMILVDTGEHEAQGVVAVAALIFISCGMIASPKGINSLSGFVPNASLQLRSKLALEKILAHSKLRKQFSSSWLNAIRKLAASTT